MTPKKILLFTKQIQTGVMLFCCTNVCCVYLFLHDLIKRRKKFVSYPREFQCWWPSFKRCLILCRLLNVKTYFFYQNKYIFNIIHRHFRASLEDQLTGVYTDCRFPIVVNFQHVNHLGHEQSKSGDLDNHFVIEGL